MSVGVPKFECRYCGNAFSELTRVGACPSCGGPKPKVLQPEVQVVVVERYVYYKPTPTSAGYYSPPRRTFKQSAYNTLGYKVVAVGTILLTVAFIAYFSYFWFFYRTGAPKDANPAYRNIFPTAVASVTPAITTSIWDNFSWLSPQETMALREKDQVVNLAYLKRGLARYADQSVLFLPEHWAKSKPLGMTRLTIDGTACVLEINGFVYHLNAYQPFVIDGQPNTLYLVDENGQTWKTDARFVSLVGVSLVQSGLTIHIDRNPNLSPTY